MQEENAVVVSKNLSSIVNAGTLTSRFDLEIVSNILESVVQRNSSSEEVGFGSCNSVVFPVLPSPIHNTGL